MHSIGQMFSVLYNWHRCNTPNTTTMHKFLVDFCKMGIVCQNMELFSIVLASKSRHSLNQLSVRYILNVKFNQMARNLFSVVSGVFGLSFFFIADSFITSGG